MPAKTQIRKVIIECLDCGARSALKGRIELGQKVACPECGAWMQIVSLDSIEVDWIYEATAYAEDEPENG